MLLCSLGFEQILNSACCTSGLDHPPGLSFLFVSNFSASAWSGFMFVRLSVSFRRLTCAPLTIARRCNAEVANPEAAAGAEQSANSIVDAQTAQAARAQAEIIPRQPNSTDLKGPTTAISQACNTLGDCLVKTTELKGQYKSQRHGVVAGEYVSKHQLNKYVGQLKATAQVEVDALSTSMRRPGTLPAAGMHELRRTLYYSVTLKEMEWVDENTYDQMMRMLTTEFLRRDSEGMLTADDVLFISTHVVVASFYNRFLWNRLEQSLQKFRTFENVDIALIKGLTTKMNKTRRGCPKETMDMRRKILNALARRVGVLANDFDLPSLIGIVSCYTSHDMTPQNVQPLLVRAINHINDFTPQECASLSDLLRKWGMMRSEILERLVERILTTETMTGTMLMSALMSVRSCYNTVREGGRNAINSDAQKQKLRAIGEQVASRMDEAHFRKINQIIFALDACITMKIYVPKKCLQNIFKFATDIVNEVAKSLSDTDSTEEEVEVFLTEINVDGTNEEEKVGDTVKQMMPKKSEEEQKDNKPPPPPISNEQARHLHALLSHYGADIAPELNARLKLGFQEGTFPDEASLHGI